MLDLPRRTRPSYTRRAQNLAVLSRAATIAAVAIGLLLLLASRAAPDRFAQLRGEALVLVAPVWSVVRVPFDWIGRGVDWAGDYIGAVERNRALERRNAKLLIIAQQHLKLQQQARELDALLKVQRPEETLIGTFAIAGASSGGVLRSAVVSGGSRQGLRGGEPARSALGLVGRTVEVGPNAARILLITDAASRVPVRVARTGEPAIAAGAGKPLLELRFVAAGQGNVKLGDLLLTSGDGGLFAPGTPVGVVVRGGETPLVKPLAQPHGLGFVSISRPYLPPIEPLSADAELAAADAPPLPAAARP